MSRDASTFLEFAGELRPFRLGLGEWEKIDEACGFGPTGAAVLFKRTAAGIEAAANGNVALLSLINHRDLAKAADIRAVILWGLVGGGMALPEAEKLVRLWVDDRPLVETINLAYLIALATLVQPEDDTTGEPGAGDGTANPSSLAEG